MFLTVLSLFAMSAGAVPTAIGDKSTWIKPSEYPRKEMLFALGGKTAVDLHLDDTGTPVRCTTLIKSPSWRLDRAVCQALMDRATFRPARDEDGDAIASAVVEVVAWDAGRGTGGASIRRPDLLRLAIDAEKSPELIGPVLIRRIVEADGSVSSCEAQSGLGRPELGDRACAEAERLLSARPVLDKRGKALRGMRSVWVHFLPVKQATE